jgi:hypothetical protein
VVFANKGCLVFTVSLTDLFLFLVYWIFPSLSKIQGVPFINRCAAIVHVVCEAYPYQ